MVYIKNINCSFVHEKLKKPFITALHEVDEVQAVKVVVELSNGLKGVGTATPNEKVTGDSLISTMDVAEKVIKPALLNKSIDNWNDLIKYLHGIIVHNTPSKAAYEIALYDLRSQLMKVPLTYLLGSSEATPVKTDYTISIGSRERMLKDAQKKVDEGFEAIKIKLGDHKLADDIQTVIDLDRALPDNVSLRLDINQAWNVKQTLKAIRVWDSENLNIDFVEQPVKRSDIYGMQQITQNSSYEIMADESVFSSEDALMMVRNHACDLINIKLMKTGGLSEAEKINTIAQTAGIPCMIGCMIESRESIAAAVAFASSHENVIYADLDSVYMSGDKGNQGFQIKADQLIPTKEIGLGFSL